jgi:hypothetical protein
MAQLGNKATQIFTSFLSTKIDTFMHYFLIDASWRNLPPLFIISSLYGEHER